MTCILHRGSIGSHGYGLLQYGKHQVLAHRLAYARANGQSVFDMGGVVMHSCDGKLCVNPAHLSLGTHADNVADKVSKGRQRNGVVTGEAHYKAKLDWATVRYIRSVYKARCRTYGAQALAAEYGVAPQLISAIAGNKIWKESHAG